MALYLDTSALLKRYVDELERGFVEFYLDQDLTWFTAGHTLVEVRRNFHRLLVDQKLKDAEEEFAQHWLTFQVIDLDAATCEVAADIALSTGVRTLDALHLGAATRAGKQDLLFLTFDQKQAQAARQLGFTVAGA